MPQTRWLKRQKRVFHFWSLEAQIKPSTLRSPSPHLENGDTSPSVFVEFSLPWLSNFLYNRDTSYMTQGPIPKDLTSP